LDELFGSQNSGLTSNGGFPDVHQKHTLVHYACPKIAIAERQIQYYITKTSSGKIELSREARTFGRKLEGNFRAKCTLPPKVSQKFTLLYTNNTIALTTKY
jgi:hypothetical protein